MNSLGWLECFVLRAWRRLLDNRSSAIIAIVAIAALLFIVGATRIAHKNVEAMADRWGQGIHMVVYLEENVTASQGTDLAKGMEELDAVANAKYLSRETTLSFLRADALAEDALALVNDELIPASIELELMPGVENLAAANPALARLHENPMIADIEFLGDWVGELTELTERGTSVTWVVLWMVVGFAAFVVAAFVRSRASERRDEERVLDLLGVTAVGRRFLVGVEGAILGIAAAGLSVVVLWVVFSASRSFFAVGLDSLVSPIPLEFLSFLEILSLVGFATLAGLGAGVIPARSHGLR